MPQPPHIRAVVDLFRSNLMVGVGVVAALGLLGFVLSAGLAGGAEGDAAPPEPKPSPVKIESVAASCQAPDSKDSIGRKVSYDPMFIVDADPETAWRCRGDGEGERLVLELGTETRIVEVGVVPGYAKTDATDGTDRYAENRRLTKVQWVFDNGASVVQEIDPDPTRRDLQVLRIEPVTTQTVAMEILGSSDAELDRIAVSTVRLQTVADRASG